MAIDLLLIEPELLHNILRGRRISKALAKLLPLFSEWDGKMKITYDELAIIMGYKNRSGSWKAIKQLEQLGVLSTANGELLLTIGKVYFD